MLHIHHSKSSLLPSYVWPPLPCSSSPHHPVNHLLTTMLLSRGVTLTASFSGLWSLYLSWPGPCLGLPSQMYKKTALNSAGLKWICPRWKVVTKSLEKEVPWATHQTGSVAQTSTGSASLQVCAYWPKGVCPWVHLSFGWAGRLCKRTQIVSALPFGTQ